jgi:Serine/threonine protein kinase
VASDKDASVASEPTAGALLDARYRLITRVGRGGMADVWLAEDDLLGRSVAVKLFRVDAPAFDERRIQAEVRTLGRLQHPGIVTVYDAGSAENTPYLVMDYVPGQSLADRLSTGPLATDDVDRLARELTDTLQYLHSQGVVHRDIKPANILLREQAGAATLADFGLARLVDASRLTGVGLVIGTANYLAPEQAAGEPIGPPADIYALGLVLLECFTGHQAFPGVGIEAALARLQRAPLIPAEVGPAWGALLAAMTSQRPSDRPTAAAVERLLPGAVATTPLTHAGVDVSASTVQLDQVPPAGTTRPLPGITATALADPAPAGPVRGRRLRRWAVLTAAVAAAVITLVAVLATGGGRAPAPTPAPSYPSVPGVLGQHLRQLESAVG